MNKKNDLNIEYKKLNVHSLPLAQQWHIINKEMVPQATALHSKFRYLWNLISSRLKNVSCS